MDDANTLYVADSNNNRIQKFLMGSSTATTIAGDANGTFGTFPNQLQIPTCILFDTNGSLFVSDFNNNRIQFWSKGASVGITIAGSAAGECVLILLINLFFLK